MAQEESVFGCSYSGGGGGGRGGGGGGGGGSCRSKKIKPKKVPQRGLGVAQLEKIRIEEEQKRESLAKNAIASSSSSPSDAASSFLGVQKFRPTIPPFHNSPPPPPPPPSPSSSSSSNLSSPNAVYRHSQSVPNIEILQENCSVSKYSNPASTPKMWGGDYNLALDQKQRLDHHQHHAFAFDPHGNLPPPHHFQPPPPPPSMVNSSSGISPSSVLTSHLEPPSNQSSRHHNYASHLIEEDKILGMKRSYPFSLESPPPPSLHCDFRPSYASSSSRSDVLALCSSGYGYTPIAESRNKCIRVSPLFEHKPDEAKDDERLNGDFLTLAPPSSNFNHNHQSEYECRSSQEYGRSEIQEPEPSGSVRESFNFFSNRMSNGVRNGNGEEEGDIIDLDLKL